jgi:uncharacterized iron-regulated protein
VRARTLRVAVPLATMLLAGCAAEAGRGAAPAPPSPAASPYVDARTLRVGQILHVATGRLLTEAEALDYLSRFPVVYVGESHDSVDDHAVELTILEALEARLPGRVAVGLEMLERPFQAEADAFIRGELSERDFHRTWQKSWGSFVYYRDILRFAREKRIPIVALNASAATRRAVRDHPLSALPPEIARDVPEMDMQDPYHRAYIEAIFARHGEGAGKPLDADAFYRVQVLWDETMAQTAAAYLTSAAGRGRHLVVLAGGNHVRFGFGIPRRLFRRLPVPFVIVEPYVNPTLVAVPEARQMHVNAAPPPLRAADIYWSVRYRDLRDEEVKLGVLVEDSAGHGARVSSVLPDGPGRAAGLVPRDLITAADGAPVTDVSDLIYAVSLHRRGEAGTLEVLRAGARVTLTVTYDIVTHGR